MIWGTPADWKPPIFSETTAKASYLFLTPMLTMPPHMHPTLQGLLGDIECDIMAVFCKSARCPTVVAMQKRICPSHT